jgi:hypothetical protein
VHWTVQPAIRRTPSPLAGASLNLEQENKDGRSQRGCR